MGSGNGSGIFSGNELYPEQTSCENHLFKNVLWYFEALNNK